MSSGAVTLTLALVPPTGMLMTWPFDSVTASALPLTAWSTLAV